MLSNAMAFIVKSRLLKSDIPVPWKEFVADVELGLWSMLSMAAVVNNSCHKLEGHTN